MRVKELALTLLLCGWCIACAANPATCDARTAAKSGTVSATVVELYTSEGCDSCPPADKWFSTLGNPRDGVVPLAFHVDYWDYIGWKDRFARPVFAQRQRDSVSRHGSRTTYTPQVMLDGRDLRAWSNPLQFQARLREVASRQPRADLSLETSVSGRGVEVALSATVALPADRTDAALYLAVTENNLTSGVTAGENKGVLLRHDHVVRELIGPIAVAQKDRAAGHFSAGRIVTLLPAWKREELSIVAFMQDARTGEVLQALSTPLCRG
ncbi:MAG: DUF1223 domain-containing protein [Betaproteobacteria bacterium]